MGLKPIRQADGDNQITFRWRMIVKQTTENFKAMQFYFRKVAWHFYGEKCVAKQAHEKIEVVKIAEKESRIVPSNHQLPNERFLFHLIWFANISNFLLFFETRPFSQEPLKSPGQQSYLKNLKTPFLGEYFKFLPLSNSYGSKTTPQNFFWKYLNK